MDDLPKTIEECLKILDDSIEVLASIEMDFQEEDEDKLIPEMELYQLFDMAEDVSHLLKVKQAQIDFMKRQSKGFQ